METNPSRRPERRAAQAFVALADTLVTGFDVVEFLEQVAEQCVQVLRVDAIGLLVADPKGRLRLMAASDEQSRLAELLQMQTEEGPCVDCFRTGTAVLCPDLSAPGAQRWPRFTRQAQRGGFAAISVLPMRLRSDVIGAMNLFRHDTGDLDGQTFMLAQAMADVATIGLLQERSIRSGQVLTEQLRVALGSRVLIEQAKGVLAERHAVTVDEAFAVLRRHARDTNASLTDLARAVVTREVDLTELAPDSSAPRTT